MKLVPRILLISLFAIAIAIRLFFVIFLPSRQIVVHHLEGLNDEPSHMNYVSYLAEHRAFPVQTHSVQDSGCLIRNDFEYYQPPLYYLLAASGSFFLPDRALLYWARGLSFLTGLISVFLIFRIFGVCGQTRFTGVLAALVAALLPTHAYFTSLASNDGLSWMLALFILLELLRMVKNDEAPDFRANGISALSLGLLLGLGMLTKSSLIVFFPLVWFVFGYRAWRSGNFRMLSGAIIATIVSLSIAGPWYARNLALYGSLTALQTGFGPPHAVVPTLHWMAELGYATIMYFWFPMQHIKTGLFVRIVRYSGLFVVVLHALIACWYLFRRRWRAMHGWILVGTLFFVVMAYIRLNLVWGEPEGRFLLPALAAIIYGFIVPVRALFVSRKEWKILMICYFSLLTVHPYILLVLSSH